jgi:hypothetical protein
MSAQQDYSVLAGISMFHGQPMLKTNSNSEEKVHPQASSSNNPESLKNTHAAPSSSSPSYTRPVGSNRFVCLSMINSNISFVYF